MIGPETTEIVSNYGVLAAVIIYLVEKLLKVANTKTKDEGKSSLNSAIERLTKSVNTLIDTQNKMFSRMETVAEVNEYKRQTLYKDVEKYFSTTNDSVADINTKLDDVKRELKSKECKALVVTQGGKHDG